MCLLYSKTAVETPHSEQLEHSALEQDLLGRCHHGQAALGMIKQVLRGHHDREVLDCARLDERTPRRPEPSLVPARGHENKLGFAQGERARNLGHVDLAAHRQPDLAVHRLENREVVARHPLEFPRQWLGSCVAELRMAANEFSV
jgi:hypothetical protein